MKNLTAIRRRENKTLHLEGRGGEGRTRGGGEEKLGGSLRSRDLQVNVLKGDLRGIRCDFPFVNTLGIQQGPAISLMSESPLLSFWL